MRCISCGKNDAYQDTGRCLACTTRPAATGGDSLDEVMEHDPDAGERADAQESILNSRLYPNDVPTPGPWKYVHFERESKLGGKPMGVKLTGFQVKAGAGVVICEAFPQPWSVAVNEANFCILAAAPELLLAAKNCGGGDLFIEDYGRTCHCPYFTKKGGVTRKGMMNPDNHSTACNYMWNAIAKAEGR